MTPREFRVRSYEKLADAIDMLRAQREELTAGGSLSDLAIAGAALDAFYSEPSDPDLAVRWLSRWTRDGLDDERDG